MDFTLKVYNELIQAIRATDYEFQTFEQFLTKPLPRTVILRNDVDRKPARALRIAEILSGLNIQATFYFRIVKSSWNERIITEIVQLGHELGYHYEDLSLARGNFDLAIRTFEKNLERFRKFYEVKTICMHGSPLAKWDNRLLWTKFNYRDYGISGEPYLDLDFSEVLYRTDTGRSWDNKISNKRDRVTSTYNFRIRKTSDIIELLHHHELPDKIMINIHPQRWSANIMEWGTEYITQNSKNAVKTLLNKF